MPQRTPEYTSIRLILLLLASFTLLLAALAALPSPVDAQSLTVPLVEIYTGNPGESLTIATQDVPDDLIGRDCDVHLRGQNNASIHPGNTLMVTSGGNFLVFADIESAPDQETTEGGTLRMGDKLVIALQLGDDGISSGGFSVVFDCAPPPTTVPSTTVPDSSTTTLPPSTPETSVPVTVPDFTG